MTTFSPIEASTHRKPSITIESTSTSCRVDDRIYSGFIEHMGRGIYGGVYEPDSKLSDENGFRSDVLQLMRDELRVPLVRYPGGNFTATYHWQDGIGSKEIRPTRPNLAWGGIETNHFGTDEFMRWCELADTEPFICLNMGTGTLDEALAWLEYCNSSADTQFALLRRSNGHQEPYKVKYWELGNETYGDWQVAQSTPQEYVNKAVQWAKALKCLDPSIKLTLCCAFGYGEWERVVIDGAADVVDFVSIHNFTFSQDALENSTAPYIAEIGINITSSLIDLAFIQNASRSSKDAKPRPKICFNEWNVWDMVNYPGDTGSEQIYTLSDSLAVATWLNIFIRHADKVAIASPAQSVNAISPLHVHPNGILKHATYHVLWLFSNFMRGRTVQLHVTCEEYRGSTEPRWLQEVCRIPFLDVAGTVDDAGFVNVVAVNRHFEPKVVDMILPGNGRERLKPMQKFEVGGDHLSAANSVSSPDEVKVMETGAFNVDQITLSKHSVTLLRWQGIE